MGSQINRLRLLYMLTELSRRISDLSPPDSILQAQIASEKSSEEEKHSGEKKYVAYYMPMYNT